jgi:hypothetical protein
VRIPIIGWTRNQAIEGMNHASIAGEHVTPLGGHPSLTIGKLTESHKHEIRQILHEHDRATLRTHYELLDLVRGRDYDRPRVVHRFALRCPDLTDTATRHCRQCQPAL